MIQNINGYPFARLSAEEEKNYLGEIFYKQQYYNALVSLAEASVSRFILGQRGQGKTATILHLIDDMQHLGVLPILIDRYDGFPVQQNKNYFLYLMIQKLTFKLALRLMEAPGYKKALKKNQQEQLSFFIEAFYDPDVADECESRAKVIEGKKRKNRIRAFINNHLLFLNKLIGAAVKVGVELIKSNTGIETDFSNVGGEYIQGFDLESFKGISREEIVLWDSLKLVKALRSLTGIAMTCGYSSVAFLFDKIDEYPGLHSETERVNAFMLDFLTDTELLYSENISIVVSLWSEVKKALNKNGVRFDKFKEVDLRWRNNELIQLMNKRLLYFSSDKDNPVSFESLIPNHQDQVMVLELVDGSPRAFISLLGFIEAEEASKDEPVVCFSADAINRGCLMFCKKYDYVSAQPSRMGKSQDLQMWITRLLRLKLTQFTLEQYRAFYKVTLKTAGSHIEIMVKYNLVKDSMVPMDNNEILYEVSDPRIWYLISRGVLDMEG